MEAHSLNILCTSIQRASFEALVAMIKTGKYVSKVGWCSFCEAWCYCETVGINISGSPCTDWTPQANRCGTFGHTMLPTYVYLAHRIIFKDKFVVHENVPEADLRLIFAVLESLYVIFTYVLDASCFGWPMVRERCITVMILREAIQEVVSPFDGFVSNCQRKCCIGWWDFLILTEDEFEVEEVAWAIEERRTAGAKALIQDDNLVVFNESRYTKLLGNADIGFLRGYRRMQEELGKQSVDMCCCLNQDPVTHPQWAIGPICQTLISNNPLMWANLVTKPKKKKRIQRWFGARELLLLMGFAAVPRVAEQTGQMFAVHL